MIEKWSKSHNTADSKDGGREAVRQGMQEASRSFSFPSDSFALCSLTYSQIIFQINTNDTQSVPPAPASPVLQSQISNCLLHLYLYRGFRFNIFYSAWFHPQNPLFCDISSHFMLLSTIPLLNHLGLSSIAIFHKQLFTNHFNSTFKISLNLIPSPLSLAKALLQYFSKSNFKQCTRIT